MNRSLRLAGCAALVVLAGSTLVPAAAAAAEAPSPHADCIAVLSSVQARQAPGATADNLRSFQSLYGPQVVGEFNQQVSGLHGDLDSCIQ
jgi:hypothetical protein